MQCKKAISRIKEEAGRASQVSGLTGRSSSVAVTSKNIVKQINAQHNGRNQNLDQNGSILTNDKTCNRNEQ